MKSLLVGLYFGFVLIKSEAISWFRIQEMFLFDSFHLYGVIGSAIITGMISILLIKKLRIKDQSGNLIIVQDKVKSHKASFNGGLIFGIGWALTGLCPGTIYANIAFNVLPITLIFVFSLIGALLYEKTKYKLPHF